MEVFVFGATGNIGSEIVRALAQHPGVRVRIGTRDVSRVQTAFAELPAVVPVQLDGLEAGALAAALSGVDRLVIVNPLSPELSAQTAALTAAARRAGVGLILRSSLMGAGEPEPIEEARWHDAADQAVRDSGVPWVILKPNQYFQNFVNFGTDHTVRTQGAIYLPYADARVSNIDTRDIGEIAANIVLAEPDVHAGREYVLTGASAQSMDEIAAAIATELGKDVRYYGVPEEAARQGMTQAGLPPVITEAILGWFAYCRDGRAARIDPAAAQLLGRAPRQTQDFVRDHAHRYRAQP